MQVHNPSMASRSGRGGLPILNILNSAPNPVPDPEPIVVIEQDIVYRAYRTFRRNGRNFHTWKAGKYPFPCDRVARDNDDVINATTHHYCYGTGGYDDTPLGTVIILPLIGGHLRLKRILDLGCGSGLFVAQAASSFPDAIVVGVDLVEGQDMQIPNAIWRVPNSFHGSALDFEEDLSSLGLGSFGEFQSGSTFTFTGRHLITCCVDYVRMAHLDGAISDVGALLRKAFDLAVPVTGVIEFTFIDWTFRTANPNPLPIDNPLSRLQQCITLASQNRNVPLSPDPSGIDDNLVRAGFAERIHRTHILPLLEWPLNACQRKIGRQMQALFAYHPDPDCKCFLEDLCLELLTTWLDMRHEEVDELIAECVGYMWRPENKIFVNLHTWTARRPGQQFHPEGILTLGQYLA